VNVTLQLSDDQIETIAERVAVILSERPAADRGTSTNEYLSVKDAAAYTGCTVGRLRKLIERRRIPSHQEGPRCRVFLSKADLDTYMLDNRTERRT